MSAPDTRTSERARRFSRVSALWHSGYGIVDAPQGDRVTEPPQTPVYTALRADERNHSPDTNLAEPIHRAA